MYHLKLKKALSYTGVVTATKKQPDVFVKQEKIAKAALATGYFECIKQENESLENKGEHKVWDKETDG